MSANGNAQRFCIFLLFKRHDHSLLIGVCAIDRMAIALKITELSAKRAAKLILSIVMMCFCCRNDRKIQNNVCMRCALINFDYFRICRMLANDVAMMY